MIAVYHGPCQRRLVQLLRRRFETPRSLIARIVNKCGRGIPRHEVRAKRAEQLLQFFRIPARQSSEPLRNARLNLAGRSSELGSCGSFIGLVWNHGPKFSKTSERAAKRNWRGSILFTWCAPGSGTQSGSQKSTICWSLKSISKWRRVPTARQTAH